LHNWECFSLSLCIDKWKWDGATESNCAEIILRRKETGKKKIYIHNNKITIAQIMSNKTENWFIKSFFEQQKSARQTTATRKKKNELRLLKILIQQQQWLFLLLYKLLLCFASQFCAAFFVCVVGRTNVVQGRCDFFYLSVSLTPHRRLYPFLTKLNLFQAFASYFFLF